MACNRRGTHSRAGSRAQRRTGMSELEPAARRVQEALRAKDLDCEVRHMGRTTRTAAEAAAACGCDVGQIVKSLVFGGTKSGTAYLLLVSGKNRVNEASVAARIGEPLVRPNANFVREAT